MCPSSDSAALEAFLDHPSRPDGTLGYHQLQGFLFTIVCAPELVPPSEWLPVVFGHEEAGFLSPDEAEAILGEIMTLYNAINAAVLDPPARLPADCPLRTSTVTNFDDEAPVAQWSRGFVRGHLWLTDDWEAYVPDELDEEFHATFMALSFFASRQMAQEFVAESEEHSLDTLAEAMVQLFPAAVATYAQLGRSIAAVLADMDDDESPPIRLEKIGRNDPCACGSGKKYKKCCGGTVH